MAFQKDAFQHDAFQTGPWTNCDAFQGFQGMAFQVGAPGQGTTPPVIVVIDTHDGGRKRRDNEFRRRNEKLREDLLNAYNKVHGISLPVETKPDEIIQAYEEHKELIPAKDKQVLQALAQEFRRFEVERKAYEKRVLEDEWDMDALTALGHLLQ